MPVTTKLFMSGRSQAIRLPAKLRMDAKQVRIEQAGNAIWMQPEPVPGQSMADWFTGFYVVTAPLPDTFLANRSDRPPQKRDWS